MNTQIVKTFMSVASEVLLAGQTRPRLALLLRLVCQLEPLADLAPTRQSKTCHRVLLLAQTRLTR